MEYDPVPNGTVPDSRTTAPQYCEAVPGGLVFKARRLFVSLNSRPRVTKKKEECRLVGGDLGRVRDHVAGSVYSARKDAR